MSVVGAMLSFLIVDESVLVRMGLKQLISEEYRDTIFGEAKTGAEALVLVSRQRWDLVILDITLPDRDAFSLLQQICAQPPNIRSRVLIMGMHGTGRYAARALYFGASGYIFKSSARPDLLKAINTVMLGRKAFDQSLLEGATLGVDVRRGNLSPREYEIMLALARGKRTGEIAAELNLHRTTVSTFKRRILNKLKLRSTADLVRHVVDNKLV